MLKLVPNLNETKYSKLKVSLDKLKLNIAKQFLNEDFNEPALLNEAAFFIFCTFYDYRACDNVGLSNSNFQHVDKLMKKLREKFGQFARNLFDSCKEVMETIYNDLKNSPLRENFIKKLLFYFCIRIATNTPCNALFFNI